MKKLLVFLILFAVGLVGIVFWFNQRGTAATQPRREKIDRGPIILKVSATGRIVPKNLTYVSADVPLGRIVSLSPKAEVGQTVEEGDELLKLDDELAQLRLAQAQSAVKLAAAALQQADAAAKKAEAGMQLAKWRLAFAEAHYKYLQKLGRDAPPERLEAAEKGLEEAKAGITLAEASILEAKAGKMTAQAKLDEAEAALKVAEQGVRAMTIKAPVKGVILEKKVVAGQLIAPQATPVLFVIAPSVTDVQVVAQVGEADISQVSRGMKATFTVDAHTEGTTVYEGTVTQIADLPTSLPFRVPSAGGEPGGTALPGPVLYNVTIDNIQVKDGNPFPLRFGFTANVDFNVPKITEAVLRVPNAALSYRPDPIDPDLDQRIKQRAASGWFPLWVWRDDGQVQLVFVQVGSSDGSRTEIRAVEGGELKEGTEVITDWPKGNQNGGPLKINVPL